MNTDEMSKDELRVKLLEGVDLLETSQAAMLELRKRSSDLSKSPEGRLNAVIAALDQMGVPE